MERHVIDLLARLEAEAREQRRHPVPAEVAYLLAGPETGQFLHILVLATRARQILEIGTSVGYSTIWLATAARQTGGRVTTLEWEQQKVPVAQRHLLAAGVADLVEILPGDARQTLATLAGPFDLIFVDAGKTEYATYLDLIYPKLSAGGLVVADNVLDLRDNPGIQAYQQRIRDYPDLETVTVPIGNGEELTVKRGAVAR